MIDLMSVAQAGVLSTHCVADFIYLFAIYRLQTDMES